MHVLVVEHRLAEDLPLPRIGYGVAQNPVQHGPLRGGEQPLFLELLHLVGEAHALLADAVALRHAHVVEEQLGGIGRPHAELLELLGDADAGRFHGNADQRLVLVRCALRGIREQADPVGLGAAGGPHLAAVDDVIAAIPIHFFRRGPDRSYIGTRARLGNAQTGHIISGDGRRQKLPPQFVGAEARQRRGGHVGLHANGHRHAAAIDVAERLGKGQLVAVVESHAAIFLRLVDAEKSGIAEFLEQLVGGKYFGRFPFVDMGIDLGVDEFLQRALQFQMFLLVEHDCPFPAFQCLNAWLRRTGSGAVFFVRLRGRSTNHKPTPCAYRADR